MTAFDNIDRLEGPGLWRPGPNAQRQNVYVSFGTATLTLTDSANRPLAHWSLPALHRLNPGKTPALYSPDPDSGETLELDDDLLINALDRIRRHTSRGRRHPGLLRRALWAGVIFATLGIALLWLPGQITAYAVRATPSAVRAAMDQHLSREIARYAGAPCTTPDGARALGRLARSINGGAPIVVLSGELTDPVHLPGGTVLLDRAMVELPEDPAVPIGEIVAARTSPTEPLSRVLDAAPTRATLNLLTTGDLPPEAMAQAARIIATSPARLPSANRLAEAFTEAGVATQPWRSYRASLGDDIALPDIPAERPLLTDRQWLAIQGICDGN